MKKSEAMALEKRCENHFNGMGGLQNVEISMALTGKLRLTFDDGFITFTPNGTVDYVKYRGFYSDLELIKSFVAVVCNKWHGDFQELLWSYEHISKLEDG